MPDAAGHPTALISWAHVDPDWTFTQTATRQQHVLALSAALRTQGVAAELDLHHGSDPVDWTRWGPAQVDASDFVLVVASKQWRSAWEGGSDPKKGAGSAAEADVLRSLYARNRDDFRRRVRLIELPGGSGDDVPMGFDGVPRFSITRFDAAGIEKLLRSITGQAEFPLAPLGPLPVLTQSHGSATVTKHPSESTSGAQLQFNPLPGVITVQWKSSFAPAQFRAMLAVHLLPTPPRPIAARQLAALAVALPARVRASGLIDSARALVPSDSADGIALLLTPAPGGNSVVEPPALQGVRVSSTGQVSAWTTLPADHLGSLIDQDSLNAAISSCLSLARGVEALHEGQIAWATEIAPMTQVNLGPASAVGRTTATFDVFGSSDLRVEPDESVDSSALGPHRGEVERVLTDVTLRKLRHRRRGGSTS